MGYTGQNNGQKEAWSVKDAPEKYIGLLTKAIMGIEIEVTRLEGKFKMSQESTEGDRRGVVEGFRDLGTPIGEDVAEMVGWREEVLLEKKKNVKSNA